MLFSRIVLLAVIDVSSFPAIKLSYLGPAYPLPCIASLLSIWIAFQQFATKDWWPIGQRVDEVDVTP
jgi:hypothetical protein